MSAMSFEAKSSPNLEEVPKFAPGDRDFTRGTENIMTWSVEKKLELVSQFFVPEQWKKMGMLNKVRLSNVFRNHLILISGKQNPDRPNEPPPQFVLDWEVRRRREIRLEEKRRAEQQKRAELEMQKKEEERKRAELEMRRKQEELKANEERKQQEEKERKERQEKDEAKEPLKKAFRAPLSSVNRLMTDAERMPPPPPKRFKAPTKKKKEDKPKAPQGNDATVKNGNHTTQKIPGCRFKNPFLKPPVPQKSGATVLGTDYTRQKDTDCQLKTSFRIPQTPLEGSSKVTMELEDGTPENTDLLQKKVTPIPEKQERKVNHSSNMGKEPPITSSSSSKDSQDADREQTPIMNIYHCKECDEVFQHRNTRDNHVNSVHRKEFAFECPVCEKRFKTKSHLNSHLRIHDGVKPFKCEICPAAFSYNKDLKKHMRIHTGEKPFKCTICTSCFANSGDLSRHMRTHSGEKPYNCTICSSCFSQPAHLSRHMRTHTGEKSYECSFCSERFSRSTTLRKHESRIHTKKFPHLCPLCGKGFASPGELKKHQQSCR